MGAAEMAEMAEMAETAKMTTQVMKTQSLQNFRQNQLNAVLPMLADASVPTPQRDSSPTLSGRMNSRGASLSTTQLQDKPCLWWSILTATPKTSFKALMPSTEGPQITRLQPDTALPG